MGNRRFEMHEYRDILARMRQGESNRRLAKTGLIGRNKAAVLRSTDDLISGVLAFQADSL